MSARKNRSVETVSATAITEDIEFNPYCSINYDDEIIDVLAGIEPTLMDEFENDILIETNVGKRYAHPFIESFNSLNSFKLQTEVMVQSTFNVTDKCRYNQLITELTDMISNYMNITKTVNVSKSTNVHALNNPSNEGTNVYVPNEPSNASKNLNTEDMNVTHFRPLRKSQTKSNWKRPKEEVDSDSDSSVVPEKLTSDHSSDNIVSDDDSGIEDISLLFQMMTVEQKI